MVRKTPWEPHRALVWLSSCQNAKSLMWQWADWFLDRRRCWLANLHHGSVPWYGVRKIVCVCSGNTVWPLDLTPINPLLWHRNTGQLTFSESVLLAEIFLNHQWDTIKKSDHLLRTPDRGTFSTEWCLYSYFIYSTEMCASFSTMLNTGRLPNNKVRKREWQGAP